MKNISTTIIQELQKDVVSDFLLLDFYFDTQYSFTNNDYPLYRNTFVTEGLEWNDDFAELNDNSFDIAYRLSGDLPEGTPSFWQPTAIRVVSVSQSQGFSVDKVTIELSNVDLEFSALLLNTEALNKRVHLQQTFINRETNAELARYSLIDGPMLEWFDLHETTVKISIGNQFAFWNKKTLRLPSPQCPWFFKGDRCRYAGAELLCDRSASRCRELNNFQNFGGREWISSTEDQQIEWGAK